MYAIISQYIVEFASARRLKSYTAMGVDGIVLTVTFVMMPNVAPPP